MKVTGMLCGPAACGEVRLILPLYTPAVRPAGLTDTVSEAGVVPLPGVTDSQLPPVATAMNGMATPPLAVMLVVWLDGVVPLSKV